MVVYDVLPEYVLCVSEGIYDECGTKVTSLRGMCVYVKERTFFEVLLLEEGPIM